jgi:hypothetical protein
MSHIVVCTANCAIILLEYRSRLHLCTELFKKVDGKILALTLCPASRSSGQDFSSWAKLIPTLRVAAAAHVEIQSATSEDVPKAAKSGCAPPVKTILASIYTNYPSDILISLVMEGVSKR